MSTPGSSASPAPGPSAASGTSSTAASTTPGVNPDKAMTRLLYAMLKQKSLKDIDWNQVAADPVLLEGISNGHAARMRYSRFRNSMENSKSKARQPKPTKETKMCSKVTKRRSVGARRVDRHALDDSKDGSKEDKDGDGDTEEDDDYTGKGKENRYQAKAVEKTVEKKTATLNPKEEPDLVDFQASFSSLPSPPMELENSVGGLDECPLIGHGLPFQTAPIALPPQAGTQHEHEHDRLHVLKKRKATMHSPSMDMDMALHQIPQAHPQARQMLGYSMPQSMGVGLGLSAGPSRIHSMPLLNTPQHQHHHQNQHGQLSSYPGSVLMMRHHSAEQTHQGLLAPRTRLLTPSSEDLHHHHSILQKPITNADVDEYLAFGAPFSAVSSATHTNPSLSDSTLDMSPYMAPGMDFAAVGDGSMDMIGSIDASTSLFALVGDGLQQLQQQAQGPTSQQQYLSAFAKHSSGWDVMISQGHV